MGSGDRQRLKHAMSFHRCSVDSKRIFQVRAHSCALQIHVERHPSSKENNYRKQFDRTSFVKQRGWVVFFLMSIGA